MFKKFCLCIVSGLVGLSLSSPFSALSANADDTTTYLLGAFGNSIITGRHELYTRCQVAGVCGVYSGVNSVVGHSIQNISSPSQTSMSYVVENWTSGDNYLTADCSISSNIGYWSRVNIDSNCFYRMPTVYEDTRYFSGYSIIITLRDSYTIATKFNLDVNCTYVNINTGDVINYTAHYDQYSMNTVTFSLNYTDFPFDYVAAPSFNLCSFSYSFYCDNVAGDIVYFDWSVKADNVHLVEVDDFNATFTPLSDVARTSSIFAVLFNTVENFFNIQLFPNFYIYDVVAIGLGASLLVFFIKLFVGG